MLVITWVVACGDTTDRNPTLGGTGTGGLPATSTGLEDPTWAPSSGGSYYLPDVYPATCLNLPMDLALDPPCSDSDLVAGAGCAWQDPRDIQIPVSELAIPTAPDLRLFLRPIDSYAGGGGEGGMYQATYPLELPVQISPPQAGSVTASGFGLTAENATLFSKVPLLDAEFSELFLEVPYPGASDVYRVARLSIVSGANTILERRIIFEPPDGCIVR